MNRSHAKSVVSLLLLIITLANAATAAANPVVVTCPHDAANPNSASDQYRLDYDRKTVTFVGTGATVAATVANDAITWSTTTGAFRLNRYSGELLLSGANGRSRTYACRVDQKKL